MIADLIQKFQNFSVFGAGGSQRLRDGLKILLSDDSERAERVQLLFSRDYDEGWRKRFGV